MDRYLKSLLKLRAAEMELIRSEIYRLVSQLHGLDPNRPSHQELLMEISDDIAELNTDLEYLEAEIAILSQSPKSSPKSPTTSFQPVQRGHLTLVHSKKSKNG